MGEYLSGFGVLIKGGSKKGDLADQILPTKETLSKPIPKGKDPVEHYMHEFKHQIGDNPPGSKKQAIAIGLSVEKEGGKRKKKGESTKKAMVAPGVDEDSTRKWRPAPKSKLNRMRKWDRKHGKWVYRERTAEDDAMWGVPPGAEPSLPAPKKEPAGDDRIQPQKKIEPAVTDEHKEKQESALDFAQQKMKESSNKLQDLLQEKQEAREKLAEKRKKLLSQKKMGQSRKDKESKRMED